MHDAPVVLVTGCSNVRQLNTLRTLPPFANTVHYRAG